ncbi:MAG: hypothetical protein ACTSSG_08575 [Candidatus Heimdallarchaeaceae archaeon]
MSTRQILQQITGILDEIYNIVNNVNWRDYSEVRVRILVTNKMDELKHVLGDIPENDVFSSEEASNFFEKILDKITKILGTMPEEKMPLQWYELELWRLRFASMYAMQWGQGGDLQVAGAAHALANVLIGIETIDVKNLIVDWSHPEFNKRKKLILNYLSSAYIFFFSLSSSLNQIYKHDLEHWLAEGLKASSEYLKYTKHFWDVKKNIELFKKIQRNVREPNYSPYYASFAGIDYLISFLIDLQKYFFSEPLNLGQLPEDLDISSYEKFFHTLNVLLDQAEFYVNDFKKHVKEGYFGLNEDPLNDTDIKETIYELGITKIWIKGLYSLYRIVVKDIAAELSILESIVVPELFKYIDRYKHLFDNPDFINSQIADGINATLEEVILFAGVTAIKANKKHLLEKIDNDYRLFFSEESMKRYPTLNGLYTTFKVTLALMEGQYEKLISYAERLLILSRFTLYEPRNSFAYSLLGNMLLMLLGKQTKEEFLANVKKKFEGLMSSFSHNLISEIEIYLSNLELTLEGEQANFNVKRLLSPQYFDPYSIFIPEVGKLAKEKGFREIVYLPFNLQSDYLIVSEMMTKQIGKIEEKSETLEAPIKDSSSP